VVGMGAYLSSMCTAVLIGDRRHLLVIPWLRYLLWLGLGAKKPVIFAVAGVEGQDTYCGREGGRVGARYLCCGLGGGIR